MTFEEWAKSKKYCDEAGENWVYLEHICNLMHESFNAGKNLGGPQDGLLMQAAPPEPTADLREFLRQQIVISNEGVEIILVNEDVRAALSKGGEQ